MQLDFRFFMENNWEKFKISNYYSRDVKKANKPTKVTRRVAYRRVAWHRVAICLKNAIL
jgi:hypothetical protein